MDKRQGRKNKGKMFKGCGNSTRGTWRKSTETFKHAERSRRRRKSRKCSGLLQSSEYRAQCSAGAERFFSRTTSSPSTRPKISTHQGPCTTHRWGQLPVGGGLRLRLPRGGGPGGGEGGGGEGGGGGGVAGASLLSVDWAMEQDGEGNLMQSYWLL